VITNAGEVFDPAAADENNAVFLKVVTFAGDVAGNLKTACQTNSGNLSES
jgi:hypothetical protein